MSARSSKGVERRKFLKGLGVAGGAVALGSAATLATRKAAAAPSPASPGAVARRDAQAPGVHVEPAPGADVVAFFGPIVAGSRLGRWTVVGVHAARMGGIPVTLATADGEQFQVDVVRRDADLPGVGNGQQVSVFVVNSGNGSAATAEEHGLGAMALADALARREAEGVAVPALLTLRERNARFPRGAYKAVV